MKPLAIPLVVISLAAGFWIGRLTSPEPASSAKERPVTAPPSPAPVRPADAPATGELAVLKETAKRQEDRIRELELQVRERPAAEKVAETPDPMALAVELWGFMERSNKRPRGDDPLKAMKLIADLKPEHAAFFIARYRDTEETDARGMAIICASIAGGPDASDFVAGLLADGAAADDGSRREALRCLSSTRDVPNRLVITDALARAGDRMLRSADAAERSAAAEILGMKPRDGATEAALRSMAEDTDDRVRNAAIGALARGGTPETLAWLKDYRRRGGLSEWLRKNVEEAVEQLEGK